MTSIKPVKPLQRLAFSYIRMSTDKQLLGHSLSRQKGMIDEYVVKHNLILVKSLEDIGLSAHSGENISSGQLGRFLDAVRDGEIEAGSVLLVESLDRLSRLNPMRAFGQFSNLLSYGIEIHTLADGEIYSQQSMVENPGKLFTSLGYMLRAHNESEEKSKRLKRKWEDKRRNIDSKILTSVCPGWLKPNDKRDGFVVKPEAVKTIEAIFDLCIDHNMGAYSIVKYLNKFPQQYPRFTKATKKNLTSTGINKTGWQKSYVTKILNNPAVFGVFHPQELVEGKPRPFEVDIEIDGYYPEVITKQRYMLAQQKIQSRAGNAGVGRKGEKFNNLFTKLIFCGRCDAAFHFVDKGEAPKGGKYLRCSNAIVGHKCQSDVWNYKSFEDAFFNFVAEIDLTTVLSKGQNKSENAKRLTEQKSVLQEISVKRKKLDDLYDLPDNLSDSSKKRIVDKMNQVNAELDRLIGREKEIMLEIARFESQNPYQIKSDLLDLLKLEINAVNDDERTMVRKRLNSQLVDIIDKIVLYDFHEYEIQFETLSREEIPSGNKLIDKALTSKQEFDKIYSMDAGRKAFNNLTKHFLVRFMNSDVRDVYPYSKVSYKPEKWLTLTRTETDKSEPKQTSRSLLRRVRKQKEN